MLDKEMKIVIRKYAIKNALDYGKASAHSVLGKVLSKAPDAKANMGELKAEIERAVADVNALTGEALQEESKRYLGEFEEEQKAKEEKTSKPRMVLEGAVSGSFVTRYPPSPNGYMHIGHAEAAYLAKEFAGIYDGRIFLYFDDTNPEKDRQEFVDAMKRDLKWLGISFDKEYYASDSIELMYESARKLLAGGDAYVCLCDLEKLKRGRFDGIECEHREQQSKENLGMFEAMLKGEYEEGAAIVRLKGDMKSVNTAMRDPTLLRIKRHPHYRQGDKYTVWPTYDLNTPVNDSVHGVTDVIRSKEYELRDQVCSRVLRSLKMREPRIHSIARLVIKNNITHKSGLNKLIREGVLEGYDDPRLVTISALRVRGVQPEAIRNFVLRFGMSKTDSSMSIDMLFAENKKVIDPIAKHLFFVRDPVKVTVKDAPKADAKLRLHPSNDMEFREYRTGGTFYIDHEDASALESGEVIRLKELFGLKVTAKSSGEISAEALAAQQGGRVVQWVSDQNYVKCSVVVPGELLNEDGGINKDSLKIVEGYVEAYATKLKLHDIVQFERFGYCVLDDDKTMKFIFISK
jgi:glutamyl-tRNA synthetase